MWLKLGDEFYDRPEIDAAGAAATGVFVRLLAYSARHLTDGHVPSRRAKLIAWDDESLIEPLIREGLVERREDGYFIPSYLDSNPPRAEVESKKQAARDRAAKSRERRGSK